MTGGKYAVFLDIDGTLSRHGMPPCQEDIEALRRARQAGHFVLINTGRSRGILPSPLRDVDYLDGYLFGCGTQLVLGGRVVFTGELDRAFLRHVIRYHQDHPDRFSMFEGESNGYTLNPKGTYEWPRITGENDFDTLYAFEHVTKVTVMDRGQADAEEHALFDGILEIVEQPESSWHEAILPGNGKGKGMLRACEHLGIPAENSIAIGDSENDLDMFACAGTAVAMENSSRAALDAARYVTGRCGEGGVAKAVNALLFGKGKLKPLRPAQG